MYIWLVILYTAAIFLAMVISLAVKPREAARLTGLLTLAAALTGFLFYGYGYAYTISRMPMAVLRAVMSVWFMFVGRNDYASVSAAPLFQIHFVEFLFWTAHLLAIYAFASATFITIGSGAIRILRVLKAKFSNLFVIFGVNRSSVAFAKNIAQTNRRATILMIDNGKDISEFSNDITSFGGIVLDDSTASSAEPAFLRTFRIRKGMGIRRFCFYALDEMPLDNIHFAECLKESLQTAGVLPQQLDIVIAADESYIGERFRAKDEDFGFGNVYVFPPGETVARMAMRLFPPAKTLCYDADGRAQDSFDALLIGFSSTAQCILKQLVMNGQIDGAGFHVLVCDKQLQEISGSFFHENKVLLHEYNIEFMESDARSQQLYDYISYNVRSLRYIIISTGDQRLDQEILLSLEKLLRSENCNAVILCCSREGIHYVDRNTMQWLFADPMTPDNLCNEQIDLQAMTLNQAYHAQNQKTSRENWTSCDYFSRTSCRAAADFLTGYLSALRDAGIPLQNGGRQLSALQWEILGRTEHRRWIAFHHNMGYQTMPSEVWDSRASCYLSDKSVNINKDIDHKLHACMIPWEELPALSSREEAVTGIRKDYQAMDLDNVRIMIASAEDGEPD